MARQKSIMVAIREPDQRANAIVRKAVALAKQQHASLRLAHVIALPYAPLTRARVSLKQAAHDEMSERSAMLTKLADRISHAGVEVRTHVEWDYPVAHALTRLVQKHKPAALLIEPHRVSDVGRLWLANLDWEVIRTCPCPVWISKSDQGRGQQRVLAAVDPFHAHDKPKPLDDVILRGAIDAAGDVRRVFMCHAVPPGQLPTSQRRGLEAEWVRSQHAEKITRQETALRRLEKLRDKYDIPARNVIVQVGDPRNVIPAAAAQSKATLIVMGVVSRSALKRIFIGATAEELLDEVSCDVLVVKPRGFQPDIPQQPQPLRAMPYG